MNEPTITLSESEYHGIVEGLRAQLAAERAAHEATRHERDELSELVTDTAKELNRMEAERDAARADAARLRDVMREHDRKMQEIWGKEEDPYACVLEMVRINWDAALAATDSTWLRERDLRIAKRVREACRVLVDVNDGGREFVLSDIRALDLAALIDDTK
jgi:hypothetical protein